MSTTQQPVSHVKVEPPETTAAQHQAASIQAASASAAVPVALPAAVPVAAVPAAAAAAPPPAIPPPAAPPVAVAVAASVPHALPPQIPPQIPPQVSPLSAPSSAHAAAVAAARAAAPHQPLPPIAITKPKPAKKSSSKANSAPPSPQVTMATAATATTSASAKGGENTGRWTAEEHRLFLQGLEQHGKGWKKIASLIKSRTVVQIRTHAQKYFQKLAKARQNGEEGDVSMEGRGVNGVGGGPHGHPGSGLGPLGHGGLGGSAQAKRRRQTSGTKRRAISSVVASAQREGKKQAAAAAVASSASATPTSTPPPPPLPAVAPALAPYVVHQPNHQPASQPAPLAAPGPIGAQVHVPAAPHHAQHPGQVVQSSAAAAAAGQVQVQQHQQQQVPGITTAYGTISGAALEDSLFRYLTPATGDTHPSPQVNDVARKVGANPITLPSDPVQATAAQQAQAALGGDISPTGVADLGMYPSWAESKEAPLWYSSGRDVDELLHEADALDWLADSGDLHETYAVPPEHHAAAATATGTAAAVKAEQQGDVASLCSENTEPNPVPGVRVTVVPSASDLTVVDSAMPPLPSLFGSSADVSTGAAGGLLPPAKKQKLAAVAPAVPSASASDASLFASATEAADATLKQEAVTDEDDHLAVFDAHFDEQAFVSALLDNNGESSASLPILQ